MNGIGMPFEALVADMLQVLVPVSSLLVGLSLFLAMMKVVWSGEVTIGRVTIGRVTIGRVPMEAITAPVSLPEETVSSAEERTEPIEYLEPTPPVTLESEALLYVDLLDSQPANDYYERITYDRATTPDYQELDAQARQGVATYDTSPQPD